MELLEVLTIGLPFCGFKVLAGLSFGGRAGTLLVALGLVDAGINAANLVGLVLSRRRPFASCSLAMAAGSLRGGGPLAKWRDLGASLDVLLAFVLVALMIGLGRLGGLTGPQLTAWNTCVILNVLGAGLGRFGASLKDLTHGTRHA
jgi:hypothetical protein